MVDTLHILGMPLSLDNIASLVGYRHMAVGLYNIEIAV